MHNVSNRIILQTLVLFVAVELSDWFPASLHFGSQTPVVGVVAYLSVEEAVSLFDSLAAHCLCSYLP